jgi:hypothetical protein
MNQTQRAGLSMWFIAIILIISMTQFEPGLVHFLVLCVVVLLAACLFVPDRPTP